MIVAPQILNYIQFMWVILKFRSYKYLKIYNDMKPRGQAIKIIYEREVNRNILH